LCVAALIGLTVAAGAGHTGAAAPVMATRSTGAVGPGSHSYVGTWAAAPQPPHDTGRSAYGFDNQTIRQIVHTHTGGSSVRIQLGNAYSSKPLTIGQADVAWSAGGAAIVPGTARRLTFGNSASIVISPGVDVLSDPVVFNVPANRQLTVDLYLPGRTGPTSWHVRSRQDSYITKAGSGDRTGAINTAVFTQRVQSFFFLTQMQVLVPSTPGTIVVLGDSITDGSFSTPNRNRRWPDALARRMQALPRSQQKAVVNAGIAGNRILRDSQLFGANALVRLDRDVLAHPGVSDVILLEGINDIGQLPHTYDADAIIGGMRQIIARTHTRGLRIFGGTLLPFEGTTYPGFYTPEGELTRQEVNRFIRFGNAFDGVIDFDRAMRNPDHPSRLLPTYDSGDHLHPNDDGYQAMANAVDLILLTQTA
jgi:lysophospholipase L1-like esterase